MTKSLTGAGAPADTDCHARLATQSKFKKHLLAGVATVALLAAGSAYTMRAYPADTLLSGAPFGASSAARAPATAIAMPGFTDVVTAVKPAVVSVRVKADATARRVADNDYDNALEGTPFERFFKEFRGPNGQRMPGQGARQPRQFVQGQGSGFFISADGYIVTNNHVVDHAVKVEILTDSGATFEAKAVGTDVRSELALIKVDGHADFPFVKLAGATPQVGEWVVAMGNPFGLGGTVTAGIVSAHGRDIGSGPYDDYIQIDAPVNRGNSGGPTFNLNGEVIGVNTAICSPSGGSVGIAFDIPATTVASVIPQLQKNGQVARGWLGVQIQPVTGEIAESLGLKAATERWSRSPRPTARQQRRGSNPAMSSLASIRSISRTHAIWPARSL
jgi:serine protease Do